MPIAAGASLLSSLLGNNDVFADTRINEPVPNSQNIALLSADVSTVSTLESKSKDKKDPSEVSGDLGATIVSDSALVAAISPARVSVGGADVGTEDVGPEDISIYVVREGDAISEIAEMFGVSANTILWANDLKKGEKLKEGDTLLILPISGVQHTVAKSETLASIAKKYKVDADVITGFNGLERGAKLAVGDELIIPDGVIPSDNAPKTNSKKSTPGSKGGSGFLVDASGYFKHPLPGMKRRSQGIHGHNAVDLAAPTGTPIIAAAGGTVLIARTGSNGGYGTMVIVQHPNGTKTLYAHMSRLGTTTGKKVAQGEVIGYVGSTGRSTGPHLHFEIHNSKAKNPF